MGIISLIKRLLVQLQYAESRRPVALKSSLLGRLPLEILLQILDSLPAQSAAIFSICCMQIKRQVGDQYLAKLSGEDTVAVIRLLALDFPGQIACSVCRKFHKMENASRYTKAYYWRHTLKPAACVEAGWRGTNMNHMISNYFSRTVFQMAMKRYQQNPENIEFLKLMSSETETMPWMNHYLRQSRTDCRIVQGSMMHRLQYVFISATASKESDAFRVDPICKVCPHIELRLTKEVVYIKRGVFGPPGSFSNPDWDPWVMRWNFEENFGEINASTGLLSCQYCWTEFRLDFKHYPSHGLAMFFTRWKNFGNGLESDNFEKHFRKYAGPQVYSFPTAGYFKTGDVSSTFEQGAELKFDSILTAENKKSLFSAQAVS